MSFEDFVGKRVEFFGVDNLTLCIRQDGGDRLAFEAVEDENDGYRSMLQELKEVPLDGLIFFRTPVAHLIVREAEKAPEDYYDFDGYDLVDDAGHRWLRLGTDNFDDYYPSFTFRYDPPKGSVCEKEHEDCLTHVELGVACAAQVSSPERSKP